MFEEVPEKRAEQRIREIDSIHLSVVKGKKKGNCYIIPWWEYSLHRKKWFWVFFIMKLNPFSFKQTAIFSTHLPISLLELCIECLTIYCYVCIKTRCRPVIPALCPGSRNGNTGSRRWYGSGSRFWDVVMTPIDQSYRASCQNVILPSNLIYKSHINR